MIQRIQSVYLLIAAILMAVTAFSPIVSLQEGLVLFSYGIEDGGVVVYPTWGIVSMAGLSALLSLISIFLYKNRKRQRNLVLVTALLVLFYFVTSMVYLNAYLNGNFSLFASISYGMIFPVIALIFLLFANKSIRKDDKLIKSLDRLR